MALEAIATSNSLWSEKLFDAFLAIDPLLATDFPEAVREQIVSIRADFERLTFSQFGHGAILDSPGKCRRVCLKIIRLYVTLSYEATDALENAVAELENFEHGA